ncbi:MAG: class I SAM-dependent methyltransferase [Patescibacteria group bacterium]
MKIDKCVICKSKDTSEWYPENIDSKSLSFTYEFSPQSQKTFRIVRCNNCTHVFCSPLPKDIYKFYEDVVDEEYLRHWKTRELSAETVLKTIRKYISYGKLLDVGCATGDFLKIAKKYGYAIEGLELSHWSSSLARKQHIKIHRKTLKSLSKEYPQKYDVITLWGVIEHFQDPKKEMLYLNELLKPGGFLVIWTGDVDGLMSRILQRRWWYWQGQHIQYFTHKSLNHLAELTGFEHVLTRRYPIAATFEQMANSLNRYKFKKYMLPFIKIAFAVKSIWYLRLPGEMFWIGRKKS